MYKYAVWPRALLYVFRRRPPPRGDAGEAGLRFRLRRDPGETPFMLACLVILGIEVPLVHLLLEHFVPALAWPFTGVTLILGIWIVGVFNAAHFLPSTVDGAELFVVDGLFEQTLVPVSSIREVVIDELPALLPEPAPASVRGRRRAGGKPDFYRLTLALEPAAPTRKLFGPPVETNTVSFEIEDRQVVQGLLERLGRASSFGADPAALALANASGD